MSGSAFMSYSRDDSAFALRLAQDLKAAGATVWLDQLDIKAGTSWDNAIEDALNAATHMLIILSPASSRSSNVRNEISYAMEQGKIVIPVLYTECTVPLQLQRSQRIDFRADYARGLTTLVHQLQGAPSAPLPKIPDRTLDHPQRTDDTLTASAPSFAHPHHRPPLQQLHPPHSSTPLPPRSWWTNPGLPIGLATLVVIAAVASAAVWVHHGKDPVALYQKALVDSSLKDFAGAAALYQQACQLQNAKSCTALALLYETGNGVAKDPRYAAALYDKACHGGDFESCSALGKRYFTGDGVPRDLQQAFDFDQMACNAGDLAGCSQLGILYVRGEGVPRDPAKAMSLFKTACDGDDPAGCSALGKHYADGDLVPRDTRKAVIADGKACDAGHASACTRLGDLYRTGDGIGQDTEKAKLLYQKGCLAGDGKACDAWLNPAPTLASRQ